jgi:hypothetical protein
MGDPAVPADDVALAAERALRENELERATALYSESLGLHRRIGHAPGIFFALNGLVMVAAQKGDYAIAQARAEEAIALARGAGQRS